MRTATTTGGFQPTDAGSCIVVEDGGALALDGAFTLQASSCRPRRQSPIRGSWAATRPRRKQATHSRSRTAVWRSGSEARRSRRGSRSIPRAGTRSRPPTTAPARSRCTRSSVVNSANSLVSARSCRSPGEARSRPHSVSSPPGDAGTAFTIAGLAREPGTHVGRLAPERQDRQPEGLEPCPLRGGARRRDRRRRAAGERPRRRLGLRRRHRPERHPDRSRDRHAARDGLHGMCVNFPARGDDRLELAGYRGGLPARARASTARSTSTRTTSRTAGWETDIALDRAGRPAQRLLRAAARPGRCGGLGAVLRAAASRHSRPRRPSSSFRPPATSPTPTSTSSTTCRWRRRSSGTRPSSPSRTSTSTGTPSSASRPTTPTRTARRRTRPRRSGRSSTCGRSSAWRRGTVLAVPGRSPPRRLARRDGHRVRRRHRSRAARRGRRPARALQRRLHRLPPRVLLARDARRAGRTTSPAGGRGMYLGSNGFYWIIAWHPREARPDRGAQGRVRLACVAGAAGRVLRCS